MPIKTMQTKTLQTKTLPTQTLQIKTLVLLKSFSSVGSMALVMIAGTALGLSACDSRSPTAKAIEEASRELSVLTTSGSVTPSVEIEQQQYKKVTETLRDVLDKGLPQERAAALVLTAHAKLGLAEHAANEFAALERESLNRATVVRGLLAAWNNHTSAAAATEGYDPSGVIADFVKQAGERGAEAKKSEAVKAELDGKIAGLRADAKAKMDTAAASENAYAALKTQAVTVSAIVAEGLIKQAAEQKNAADVLRHDAALVTAKTDQLDPQAKEAELQVKQFKNQRQTLETMAAQLNTAYEESKKEAAGARADADAVAKKLETELGGLKKQREDAVSKAFDTASSQFADAAGTARKATGDENGASKLAVGAAKQSAGDLHWARAQGQRAYADLLRSLAASSTPGLPDRTKYLTEGDEVLKAMKESIESAKGAYEEARSAYTSAKATGEAKEKLQNLGSILEKMPDLIDGKIPNLSAAMAAIKKSETASEETPAPAAAEAANAETGDLNETVDAVLLAMTEKRVNDLRAMTYFAPGYEAIGASILTMGESFSKLDAACKAKFGTGAEELMKSLGGAGGAGGGNLSQLNGEAFIGKKAADLEIKAEGGTATAGLPGTEQTLHFVKVEAAWKLDLQLEKLMPAGVMEQASAIIGPLGEGLAALAAEVEAGKYKSIEAVKVGLLQKLQASMGALQQGGGGGGG